jgi:hypothetical protein
MEQFFISNDGLIEVIDQLSARYSVFTPARKEKAPQYAQYGGSGDGERSETPDGFYLGEIRASEPLKAFYFNARKLVSVNFDTSAEKEKPLCLVGVKACDLKSLEVLDGVFIDADFTDPFYANARKENLIISSDCSAAAETCFCLSLRVDPYPKGEFDLNLSAISKGFIVEVGSGKGSEIVSSRQSLFSPIDEGKISERDNMNPQFGRRKGRVASNAARVTSSARPVIVF